MSATASPHRAGSGHQQPELLSLAWGEVGPDGVPVGVAAGTDFPEYGCYILGCFRVAAGDGAADEFEAFEMAGGV